MKCFEIPSIKEIINHWSDNGNKNELIGCKIDWNTIQCWACRENWDNSYNDWESAPLYKHYMIPPWKGGVNHPSNIFLLCNRCHFSVSSELPIDVFIDWAKKQPWFRCRSEEAEYFLKTYGISEIS